MTKKRADCTPEEWEHIRERDKARQRERYLADPAYRERAKAHNRKSLAIRRKNGLQYAYQRKWRTEYRARWKEWLSTKCCAACDEADPDVLDCHHKDPTQKDATIAQLLTRAVPWEQLMTEVEKCDILCANCHRRLHAQEKRK
jgi:hypothetical protein